MMRKLTALFVGIAFSLSLAGFAAAQTSTPSAPAPAPEKKAPEKVMPKKADKVAEMKAECLQKAGTDEAKKAECEKQAKKAAKEARAAKKAEKMEKPAAPPTEKKQ